MNIDLVVAIIGIGGLIVGAWFARGRELEKSRRDQLAETYTMYIDAQSLTTRPISNAVMTKLLMKQNLTTEELQVYSEVNEKFATAHSRIMLYGSPEVISALSNFYNFPGGVATADGRTAYSKLIQAMRRDSNAKDYGAFETHLDNVMITGPDRRRNQASEELMSATRPE